MVKKVSISNEVTYPFFIPIEFIDFWESAWVFSIFFMFLNFFLIAIAPIFFHKQCFQKRQRIFKKFEWNTSLIIVIFFLIVNNFSSLLCKINCVYIFNMVDSLRFLSYSEVPKFWSNQNFVYACMYYTSWISLARIRHFQFIKRYNREIGRNQIFLSRELKWN